MSQENIKQAIQKVIEDMMDRVMNRVLYEDPFDKEQHTKQKPLYAALVPEEIFKGSHFERRFVTRFGNAWEELAVVVATEGLGYGKKQHTIEGFVKSERLQRIDSVLNQLEHQAKGQKQRQKPHWQQELDYILAGGGTDTPVTVVCDVFAENHHTNERYAFELKAPKPNSDQTKVSKQKLFKLYSMEPPQIEEAYFALPYNPYGHRQDYDWKFPARWFNMQEDKVVLIGDEFWEKVGGVGTYQTFIEAVNEIGDKYQVQIYRDYLGIEPPQE